MKKKQLSNNTVKYNNDIYDSDYRYYQMEAEYMALHCQPCPFIKSLVIEFIEKLNLRKYSYTHRKIKREITFWNKNKDIYVYIRYDLYGYFLIPGYRLKSFQYNFKATSADQIFEKIENFLKNVDETEDVLYNFWNKRDLVETWRKRRERDKDGFLVITPEQKKRIKQKKQTIEDRIKNSLPLEQPKQEEEQSNYKP